MGKQPKELLQALLSPAKLKRPRLQKQGSSGHWWNRLPQFLNMARYTLQALQKNGVMDYDPFYLHITPAEVHPLAPKTGFASQNGLLAETMMGQTIGMESFRFLLDQLPGILAIDFSGQIHDPLKNPELLDMVDYAYQFNGAESVVYTDGFLLAERADEMVRSSLHAVVINMIGHRPSSYSLLSGNPLNQFMDILNNVKFLLQRKQFQNSSLSVEVRFTIDIHNYREIPDMIQFAEALGLNGVHFENYLPDGDTRSDRSLYSHHTHIVKYLRQIEQAQAGKEHFTLKMPKLLEADMSEHRLCKDAFNTVSVDAEFNVSACSRHLLLYGQLGKIWDEDFFNNPMYQWLRGIYNASPNDAGELPPVPLACQGCPKNMPDIGTTVSSL